MSKVRGGTLGAISAGGEEIPARSKRALKQKLFIEKTHGPCDRCGRVKMFVTKHQSEEGIKQIKCTNCKHIKN